MSSDTVSVAEYILTRLQQVGTKSIFGVPGDFNLHFLDYIEDNKNFNWVGCCNELNSAYAADGYARTTGTLGVLVTTFGVGELSAINGVGGAMSERVPTLQIVGVPSRAQQAHRAIIHHTMGDGRMGIYVEAVKQVTVVQETLWDPAKAPEQIDRVICTILLSNRPGYLTLPLDMPDDRVPRASLDLPLSNEIIRAPLYQEPAGLRAEEQAAAVTSIVDLFTAAKSPAILVDVGAVRYGVIPLVEQLAESTGMTIFTTSMAKGAINPENPRFGGVYIGGLTLRAGQVNFEKADFVITVGLLNSDFNSGGYTFRLPAKANVELHSDHTIVNGTKYPNLTFFTVLPALQKYLTQIAGANASSQPLPDKSSIYAVPSVDWEQSNEITQDWFWPIVARYFKDRDVIVSETGTPNFGLIDVPFPANSVDVCQMLYGSIGYSVGAALGAAVGAKENNRRAVAFIGDGSAQLTAPDFSTMMRQDTTPVIFLINNDGYTVERLINGPTRLYNDIQPWRWLELPSAYGAKPGQVVTARVSNPTEFLTVMDSLEDNKMYFIEVIMGRMDAPRLFNELLASYNKET